MPRYAKKWSTKLDIMNKHQVKNICAKFPELEIEIVDEDRVPFYCGYVKCVDAVDGCGKRVLLFGYSTNEDFVKYSRYVTLNLAQFKTGNDETKITFPDPYKEITQPDILEKEIKISLLSIRLLEEAKKKFNSNLKKLELDSDFED